MTAANAVFHEATAERRVAALPLSHLSIELGHLYMEDFAGGPEQLQRHFATVAPWVTAARSSCVESLVGRRARISTCFLIDDYFTRFSSPDIVVRQLDEAARKSGLELDYVARESACAEADGVALARLVQGRLVADPAPDSNGSRPPPTESGWLCNGQRSPTGATQAMEAPRPWAPPAENGARHHSIFVDVELWSEHDDRRRWSCAFLATVWQLLRLGLLRADGEPVAQPVRWEGELPGDWDRLPAIVQLTDDPAPFSAYRTLSVLSNRFLATEHAVRTVLGQVSVDRDVLQQVLDRSRAEELDLPPELVDRIDYVFAGTSAARR